jgi:hypothetical protein
MLSCVSGTVPDFGAPRFYSSDESFPVCTPLLIGDTSYKERRIASGAWPEGLGDWLSLASSVEYAMYDVISSTGPLRFESPLFEVEKDIVRRSITDMFDGNALW